MLEMKKKNGRKRTLPVWSIHFEDSKKKRKNGRGYGEWRRKRVLSDSRLNKSENDYLDKRL